MAAHGGVRPAAGRRSSGARDDHSDPPAPGGAARCGATVECRPQHLVQFAVMGSRLRARRARVRVAARRAAVGRRGREQGQRADPRGAPAAQGRAGRLHRQRRGARRLRRRRRRDRLRRLHRQRHAEDQRRAGRDGRSAAARRAVGDVRHAGRLPALAAGVPPLPPARRLLGVRRRAARRPERPLHRRPRPLVGQGGAQRRRTWRARFAETATGSTGSRREHRAGAPRVRDRAPS